MSLDDESIIGPLHDVAVKNGSLLMKDHGYWEGWKDEQPA
jgi:hypothetical protein